MFFDLSHNPPHVILFLVRMYPDRFNDFLLHKIVTLHIPPFLTDFSICMQSILTIEAIKMTIHAHNITVNTAYGPLLLSYELTNEIRRNASKLAALELAVPHILAGNPPIYTPQYGDLTKFVLTAMTYEVKLIKILKLAEGKLLL